MAWAISISSEGWEKIRAKLETWDREALIEAINDDTFERVLEEGGSEAEASKASKTQYDDIKHFGHDTLVDCAFELVEQTNTCDNGGWWYWVDREGYHKVYIQ